jgi:hypothetical protein
LNQPSVVRSDRGRQFEFVEKVQNELGFKAEHGEVIESGDRYEFREQIESYGVQF